MNPINRRDFLRLGTATSMGVALSAAVPEAVRAARADAPLLDFRVPPIEVVRVGFVGVGGMGMVHLQNLLNIEGVELRAICDIVPEKVAKAQQMVVDKGQPRPEGYDRGPYDFRRMCDRADLDLVFNVTPWEWHVPIAVEAMEKGKHAAIEVPLATTLEECWQLVEVAERHQRHCMMLENCCYDREEMLCLNLVKQGLLGEVLHGECGYLHDLRAIKFSSEGEGLWRLAHSARRNANLYPTHGLGPVAQCMDVNRGDRFAYLVSMSSPSMGLNAYAAAQFGTDDPRATQRYALGDVNVSLLRTARGKVVTLYHDTNLPRPYSRIHIVQGTNGLFEKYPDRVHIEGRSKPHQWDNVADWETYLHPLWKEMEPKMQNLPGHGGMDFLEDYRLIRALRAGEPLDMDLYDGLTWSVVTPLSEQSVANRSMPVDFPDFTRGAWMQPRPLHVMAAGS
jgi:hypothetical protein